MKRVSRVWTFSHPKSHQRSWWIVHTQPTETAPRLGFPKSHQRSWWIVHTLPTPEAKASDEQFPSALELAIAELCGLRLSMNNPPTALVGPPTKLVDRSYSAYKAAA